MKSKGPHENKRLLLKIILSFCCRRLFLSFLQDAQLLHW